MIRLFYLLCAALVCLDPVQAMKFEVATWNAQDAVRASGQIDPGDTVRFKAALSEISPSLHGAKIVLLDSPGGSVAEALRMSLMLDQYNVHMIIPDGALCASACASILFIAGKYRTVEPLGAFGQHSCSVNGIADTECNELLAQHALEHGVSFGSVAAFVTFVPPSDILWFSRSDVDCWGISFYPFTRRSGFEKSEPCAIMSIAGHEPPAQSAWRIDFQSTGYRAFLRPASDHRRELELGLYCDEVRRGFLFLGMDIEGRREAIMNAITGVGINASPVVMRDASYEVIQLDDRFSRVVAEIPEVYVRSFLTKTEQLSFTINLRPPYQDISAETWLTGSREALIFAANNCTNK